MRPIHVVSVNANEANAIHVIEPPPMSARSCWGPPLIIAHYGEVHYETAEVVAPPAEVEQVDGE